MDLTTDAVMECNYRKRDFSFDPYRILQGVVVSVDELLESLWKLISIVIVKYKVQLLSFLTLVKLIGFRFFFVLAVIKFFSFDEVNISFYISR